MFDVDTEIRCKWWITMTTSELVSAHCLVYDELQYVTFAVSSVADESPPTLTRIAADSVDTIR